MAWVDRGARTGLRWSLLGLAAGAAALSISSDAADARHHHRHHVHYAHASRGHRHAHVEEYSPPFASIVVDGNSGGVLQESQSRRPAPSGVPHQGDDALSAVRAPRRRQDQARHARSRFPNTPPNRRRPSSSSSPARPLAVEDAIKAIVTKSANDAAVTVAENLGGDEDGFAKLMTQKARALGMTRTTYVNASGLPNDDQITTARDQALLGRAIQDRFPRYLQILLDRVLRLSRRSDAQSQSPARRRRRRRRHQDRLHARVGLQPLDLGAS